jgi:hypothetical protein
MKAIGFNIHDDFTEDDLTSQRGNVTFTFDMIMPIILDMEQTIEQIKGRIERSSGIPLRFFTHGE